MLTNKQCSCRITLSGFFLAYNASNGIMSLNISDVFPHLLSRGAHIAVHLRDTLYIYTGWPFYLKTLKYLENYASDKKKWVIKVVRLEGGHPTIPNSTPHRHPLGVGVGGR